jgi:preprotein translocase subunit SecG
MVILLQKGRGGGLSGAFGGAGGHSAFGTKTGDVFTWITVALAAMFVIVAAVGNFTMVPEKAADRQAPTVAPAEAPPDQAGPSDTPQTTQPDT